MYYEDAIKEEVVEVKEDIASFIGKKAEDAIAKFGTDYTMSGMSLYFANAQISCNTSFRIPEPSIVILSILLSSNLPTVLPSATVPLPIHNKFLFSLAIHHVFRLLQFHVHQ